ncbi:MAG: adenylate/guanylate cyclase domain-containing protein [Actinomycetota bacterium]|nr:adenylate/guanylate cyclase domain-containing protein [Actinomycetota bacterium]
MTGRPLFGRRRASGYETPGGGLVGTHLAGVSRGARIVGRPRLALGVFALLANAVPGIALFFYLQFLAPGSGSGSGVVPDPGRANGRVLVTLLVFLALTIPVGAVLNAKSIVPVVRWLGQDRPATPSEQLVVLRQPLRQALIAFAFWAIAAVIFGSLEAALGYSSQRVAALVIGIILAGIASCSLSVLLVERLFRPLVAVALSGDLPARPYGIGVAPRILLSWAFGSGVPLLGLLLTPAFAGQRTLSSFAEPLALICAAGLLSGFTIMAGAARTIAEPLDHIRAALARVEAGDLDVGVAVDDGSEVGQLQAGVNRMVAGLRQRRDLEDLLGRYVGFQVASGAVERGLDLSGEKVEATALFVDLIGSTALAEALPPEAVVRALNVYFAAVIAAVGSEDGWVNKFEGDGALCIFGPPSGTQDHAGRALRAAVAIRHAVDTATGDQLPLTAAVGVSSGTVVAGNIGSRQRFEYTVIGDPVNEASRLTELAKAHHSRVLASGSTVSAAGAEGRGWEVVDTRVLRGRSRPTSVFAPKDQPGAGQQAGLAP